MPLQQDRAAVFRRPLEAFVDVFHQQVHAVLVEGLHPFLNVAALEGTEHLQHQTLCAVLKRENTLSGLFLKVHMNNDACVTAHGENQTHLDVLILCVDWWVLQNCM